MSESDRNAAISAEGTAENLVTDKSSPSDHTRRSLILTALATGVCIAASTSVAAADEDQPGSDERPQKADLLVVSEGDEEGQVIKPQDLKLGGPPVHAWPKDPKTSVVRSGSRLNELLVIRLDPAVAYSAVCAHAGCPVTGWVKGEEVDKDVFKCFCHNSEYDPRRGAEVVFGPAPRRLAALPLAIVDGSLVVAASFVGKVGAPQG
jgi:rieske iron-sulfur protein